MNLFGDIVGKLAGGSSAGGGQQMIMSILELLNNQQGGISGLASAFQRNGLGDVVTSWIGTGQNLPISADQLRNVLSPDQIQAFAQKAGISGDGGSQLAELLPGIVDKLTPGGQMPQGGDLMSTGMSLLQGLMSGKPGE